MITEFTEQDTAQMFSMIEEGYRQMTESLRGVLGLYTIDEMALLFADHDDLHVFINHAVQREGVQLFNHATDRVTTGPIASAYRAFYWFLTSGNPRYRLELMMCSGGSPLHHTLAQQMTVPPESQALIVHASFKCPAEEDYAIALATLRASGWEMLQRCDASYGKFSYWHNPDAAVPGACLLKPRVNLRDAA